MSTKISIFLTNVDTWLKFHFLTKTSFFDRTSNSFDREIRFWINFRFLTHFIFFHRNRFLTQMLVRPKLWHWIWIHFSSWLFVTLSYHQKSMLNFPHPKQVQFAVIDHFGPKYPTEWPPPWYWYYFSSQFQYFQNKFRHFHSVEKLCQKRTFLGQK